MTRQRVVETAVLAALLGLWAAPPCSWAADEAYYQNLSALAEKRILLLDPRHQGKDKNIRPEAWADILKDLRPSDIQALSQKYSIPAQFTTGAPSALPQDKASGAAPQTQQPAAGTSTQSPAPGAGPAPTGVAPTGGPTAPGDDAALSGAAGAGGAPGPDPSKPSAAGQQLSQFGGKLDRFKKSAQQLGPDEDKLKASQLGPEGRAGQDPGGRRAGSSGAAPHTPQAAAGRQADGPGVQSSPHSVSAPAPAPSSVSAPAGAGRSRYSIGSSLQSVPPLDALGGKSGPASAQAEAVPSIGLDAPAAAAGSGEELSPEELKELQEIRDLLKAAADAGSLDAAGLDATVDRMQSARAQRSGDMGSAAATLLQRVRDMLGAGGKPLDDRGRGEVYALARSLGLSDVQARRLIRALERCEPPKPASAGKDSLWERLQRWLRQAWRRWNAGKPGP